jgi:tRNA pseudouridine38-40 synthase
MAIKLGYLGDGFFGYQRQPDRRTVEGCLIESLREAGLISDTRTSRFASAGRTDRGVSALGQVISFDLSGAQRAVCRRLNSKLPRDIFAWAQAEVPDGFDPRRGAGSRTYVYSLAMIDVDPKEIHRYCGLFTGTHDFSQFSRPSGRQTTRTVDEIAVLEGDHVMVRFRAQSFLWMQVRKMVTGLISLASGDLVPEEVEAALGGRRLAIAPAPAENLILQDIHYPDTDFRIEEGCVDGAKEFLNESISRLEVGLSVRRRILAGLLDAPVA